MFDIEAFLAQPTFETLNKLLKDELIDLANYLKVHVAKPILKDDVRTRVLDKLIELGKLTVPDPSPVEQVDGAEQVPFVLPPEGDKEELVAPVTPHSWSGSHTGGTSEKARIRVRVARLQAEAEERAKKAEYDHKLEIKWN